MKVIGFNGSPRKGGNTEYMIKTVFAELEKHGIETELIQVGGKSVRGCTACLACRSGQSENCVIDSDPVNEWVQKMVEADGIIMGSPTYFSSLTPELKALIDRAGYITLGKGGLLKRKVGVALAAVRRAGGVHVFDQINHFFHISQMVMPGASYWNLGVGREKGEFLEDEEGIRNMRTLADNMIWLLNLIDKEKKH
ncbi:MAG: FMN reductase [Candidatus Cloacimonadota bacterium]|nr:MAG: FMN reductase [Candidatus Cloacimonadota bacterium]